MKNQHTTEHDGTRKNKKSGGEVAEQKGRFGKSDSRYWHDRVEPLAYTRDGERVKTAILSVRLMHQGRREYFSLDTANKASAARKAVEIWMFLRANGWEQTLAKFKPEPEKPNRVATVGEFLAAVEMNGKLKPKTFADYARALRLIAGTIAEIPNERGRFGAKGEARLRWLKAVNDVSLSELSPEAVHRWKLGFLAVAGSNPAKQQTRKRSANSLVLQAKSLFAPRQLKFLNLILPNPLPFTGYEREKEGSYRYVSRFNVKDVLAAAQKELAQTHPEEFKILLLAVGIGLRRKEIDNLEWSAFDFATNTLHVELTEFLSTKSADSVGEVSFDSSFAAIFRSYYKRAKGQFVVNSNQPARPDVAYSYYRCNSHFASLLAWLRMKGVSDRKPLHALRKEFGSLINEQYDIHAASRALRHADIAITARHYLDLRKRVTLKFSGLMGDDAKTAPVPSGEELPLTVTDSATVNEESRDVAA